ncbi:FimV/HubP family polar landmark protein [Pistricoccus aurantiacus]|uniref:FimV/HubP family polar landmark protein n=1 Tax=Pistricoccus aurantiacus TaxID=1883414 RepID=UPI00363BE903
MKAKLSIAILLVASMASIGAFAFNEAPSVLLAQLSENDAQSDTSASTNGAATRSIVIGEGDTLWSLAARLRPSEDIAIQQMVLALVEANPRVFPGGDLNRMRTGQRLVVPSREMIEKRSVAEAKRQYQARSQPSQADETQAEVPATASETVTEEPPARIAPEDVEKPQETTPSVDVAGANELQVAIEAGADTEEVNTETPQLVDRRLAALAMEMERQADRDELEALRNRNQAMRNQLAQQQQELIALEARLSAANVRAQEAEQEAQRASSSSWQTWGWVVNAVVLVLIVVALVLYRRRQKIR